MADQQDQDSPKNELRVSKLSSVGRQLGFIHKLLVEGEEYDYVIMRGAGPAIPKVVQIADICRRKIKGLSSHNEITTLSEEFTTKDGETRERNIIMMKVTLYKQPPENYNELVGY